MQEKLIQINKLLRSEILQKIILVAGIIILVTISTQTYFQAIKTHGIGLTTIQLSIFGLPKICKKV